MNPVAWSSEDWLKGSVAVLHVVLILLVVAVLRGRESGIIADMFSTTSFAILANLAVISGNKALQKVVDKQATVAQKSTVVTSTTTETAPIAATDSTPAS